MISKYRPSCPIIGCSTNPQVCRQMNLSWGVTPLLIKEEYNTDDLFEHAVEAAESAGIVKSGELVVISAGVPLGVAGMTNLIKVHVVGHILLRGTGLVSKKASASLCVGKDAKEIQENFKSGEIVVVKKTDNSIIAQLKQAAGIVVETDDPNCHAAVVGYSLDIPVIIGATHATDILKNGAIVTIDGEKGTISCNS